MRKFIISMLLLFTIISFGYAQDIKVTGTVTDAAGHPMPGASIALKRSGKGVNADVQGRFSITVPTGTILLVSSVGYDTKEVAATTGSELNIQLNQDAHSLSEVVVTGVGVATNRKKVAIDVATVTSRDFAKSATASVEQGIMGQIAGAQIQQTSGQPNSGFNIVLRGVNSLGGSNPMILVDGLEVNNLSDIDPSIVERVEVVKGAAAGMLYGAQGANGVIQIFTKKGVKGKMSVTVSSKSSWDNILRGHEIVAKYHHFQTDAQGYILTAGGKRITRASDGQWDQPAKVEASVVDAENNKPFVEPTYDHIAQAFHQAYTQTHNVSISGGNDKADYALSASYLNQQDVFSNTFKRLNLDMNLGVELARGFTIRNNMQLILSDDNTLSGDRFAMINSYNFIDFKWRDSTGHLAVKPRSEEPEHNPLSEHEWHQNYARPTRLVDNVNLNYKINRFLTLDYKFGLDKYDVKGQDYYLNQSKSLTANDLVWGNNVNGSITKSLESRTFINSLASAFVNLDLDNDLHLHIPLKSTTQLSYDYRKDDHFFEAAEGVNLPPFPPATIGSAQTTLAFDYPSSFTPGTFVTFGYLFNQTFDYANLFGFSGGFRSDYSSEFGAASKPFNFYRGTAYLRLSEWLRNLSFLTDWKIRGAYGQAGIQPGRYQRQVTLGSTQLGSGLALSNNLIGGNPDLRVQVSKELEAGTDITLRPAVGNWFSKLFLSATYWHRRSNDIIQTADVAITTGQQGRTDNLSTFTGHGVDLTIDATILSVKDLVWNFGYRMGFSKTIVDNIANGLPVTAGFFSIVKGQQLGELVGQYVLRDINQKRPDGTPYIADADKKYYVLAGGYVTDTRKNTPLLSASNDVRPFGNVYPTFNAAFINSFTIKRYLTVSLQVDWYQGNKVYNASRQWMYRDESSADYDQPVTIGAKKGAFVRYYTSFYNTVNPLDYFAENASFVRLRNASVSYDLAPLFKKDWLKGAELTLSGRNLLTITKYKGLDPENTSSVDGQGVNTSASGGFKGVDYFGVPNTRSYQVGVTLHF